jgi:hypothetical protein
MAFRPQLLVKLRRRQRTLCYAFPRGNIGTGATSLLGGCPRCVPANDLIRGTIKSREEEPRMPAILEDDAWSTWLGEDGSTPAAAKAVLKTMEGVNWTAAPEPKKPTAKR